MHNPTRILGKIFIKNNLRLIAKIHQSLANAQIVCKPVPRPPDIMPGARFAQMLPKLPARAPGAIVPNEDDRVNLNQASAQQGTIGTRLFNTLGRINQYVVACFFGYPVNKAAESIGIAGA
ncbi:MAG: hypothetical protein U5P41_09285 [Gammaproteobacteria bacterium]|nr:hypothetical protein [Gammaproteobacteria bacterium]